MQNMYAPMAQTVQSQGRGGDSMLVHMTPGEVGGLQALASAAGGSLTINPETGLPEAFFLKKLLPTILGVGLAATGIGAPLAAGIVGAGQTALTGDLGKGLMAGLGAFGGASLAGGIGLTGAGEAVGTGVQGAVGETVGSDIALNVADQSAQQLAQSVSPELLANATAGTATPLSTALSGAAGVPQAGANIALNAADQSVQQLAQKLPPKFFTNATAGTGGTPFSSMLSGATAETAAKTAAEQGGSGLFGKFGDRFGAAAREGLSGKLAKYAPTAAAVGLGTNIMSAMEPEYQGFEEEDREVEVNEYGQPRFTGARRPKGEAYRGSPYRGEMLYFDPVRLPVIGTRRVPYAEGDEVAAETVPAAGLGATLAAQLPQFTQQFQTSPGPISGVPFGYGEGQAPSELIRAQMIEETPTGGGEVDFDLDTPTRRPNPFEHLIPNINVGEIGAFVDPDAISQYLTNLYYSMPAGMGQPSAPATGSAGAPINQAREAARGGGPNIPSPRVGVPDIVPMPDVGSPLDIQSGGFVMPARETAEFGNGSTAAGQNVLAGMGGIPINGAGDGVSDSIPAMVDGNQPAALASGETYFPPQVVEAMGGADQMRKMMLQAQRSRKNANRGGLNTIQPASGSFR